MHLTSFRFIVAPFVGVWIEIFTLLYLGGLPPVAPFVGVWIEIVVLPNNVLMHICRSLRGSVD